MSSGFNIKFEKIRDSEGLSQIKFGKIVNVHADTIRGIEKGRHEPSTETIQNLCVAYPQYTLWLMTDTTNIDAGQISPDIEESRQNLSKGLRA